MTTSLALATSSLNQQSPNMTGSELTNESSDIFFVFNLKQAVIDSNRFISSILPSFDFLSWDYYDVRRERIILTQQFSFRLNKLSDSFYLDYYKGLIADEEFERALYFLSPQQRAQIMCITPYRKKAVSKFALNFNFGWKNNWDIEKLNHVSVSQNVAQNDIRSVKRDYSEINSSVTSNNDFLSIIKYLAKEVQMLNPDANKLNITAWQVSVHASNERLVSNSPEGIHQDGADYIVSALVIERTNITGGVSRIFGPDKKSVYLTHCLQPGEGIFQSDAGSNLWHDATPIKPQSHLDLSAVRKTFGFDLNIV